MLRLLFDIETTAAPPDVEAALPDKVHCIAIMDVDTGAAALFVDYDAECTIQEAHEWAGMDIHGDLADGVQVLESADMLIGHSISRFDVPTCEERLGMTLRSWMYDTFAAVRQQYHVNLEARSFSLRAEAAEGLKDEAEREAAMDAAIPADMCFRNSLAAWGYRLGRRKLDYTGGWERLTPDMATYCLGDLDTNLKLFECLTERSAEPSQNWPVTPVSAMLIESGFSYLLAKQRRNGVGFDKAAALKLYDSLTPTLGSLECKLRDQVQPWYQPDGQLVVPKRTAKSNKYQPGQLKYRNVVSAYDTVETNEIIVKDGVQTKVTKKELVLLPYVGERNSQESVPRGAYQKIKRVEFNPGSDIHVAHVLMQSYDWDPPLEDLTKKLAWIDGRIQRQPTVKSEVLEDLPFDIVPDLLEYRETRKLLGMIQDGNKSWMRYVIEREPGRYTIHGRVDPSGTRTSRAAHLEPNLGQIPSRGKWGDPCRALFGPTRPGWVQVGVDAKGLQLRGLGHYMAPYDGGALAASLEREDYDVHADWQRATGLFYRSHQKTLNYAWLFGAGKKKRGYTAIADHRQAFKEGVTDIPPPPLATAGDVGQQVGERLLNGVDGLGALLDVVYETWRTGFIVATDGRVIPCSAQYGALNDLLQSWEAVVMKTAHCIAYMRLLEHGYVHGRDYAFMLHVHDECQMEAHPACAERVGQVYSGAIREAGEALGMAIELAGDVNIGTNWKETH